MSRIMKVKSESESHLVTSDSLQPHGLYSPWNSLGQNTGVGSLSLLQGIFPNQGLNPCLPHCRWILYQLSHQGSPRILEWVAYPFSSGSSLPRNWTGVSCIAGGFFTNWAIREAPWAEWGLGKLCTYKKSVFPNTHFRDSQRGEEGRTLQTRARDHKEQWTRKLFPREKSGLKHGIILHPRQGPSQCWPS